MLNQYVNMSPQQRMAQMLQQQQSQQTPLQGQDMTQMPQAQNPFAGASDVMNKYGQYDQMAKMKAYQDMMARQGGAGVQNAGDMSAQSMPVTSGGYIQPTPLGS